MYKQLKDNKEDSNKTLLFDYQTTMQKKESKYYKQKCF